MTDPIQPVEEKPVAIKPSTVIRKSAVRQTVSTAAFIAGLCWFMYQLGEMFTQHSDWASLRTPMAVGEMFKMAGGAGIAICGALGINVRDLFAKKVKE